MKMTIILQKYDDNQNWQMIMLMKNDYPIAA